MVLSKRSSEDTLVDIDFSKIDDMEGHRFEYFIAKVLRKNGFKNVNVTKASGDYGVDITANKDNQKWAFQCKRYSSNLGLKPIQEIYAGAKKYEADKAVVFTNVYFTPNAQTLAKTLNVELWDRDTLAGMIGKDPETKQSIEADMEEEQTEPEQRQRKIRDNEVPLKLQKNQILLAIMLLARIYLLECTILNGCSVLVYSKSIKKKETQRLALVHILNTLAFSTIMNIVSLSM